MFNPENFIGYLLKSSGRAFSNAVNNCIKEKGLPITIEQMGIIFRLTLHPGSTQKEISEFFFKDKTTIARVVGTMERNSLLVRVPSEIDKRINLLYLTTKGKSLQGDLAISAKSTAETAISGIDPDELTICKKVLKQIRKNLEK
jgi:DNA-binding MarR family transcriptional regulator